MPRDTLPSHMPHLQNQAGSPSHSEPTWLLPPTEPGVRTCGAGLPPPGSSGLPPPGVRELMNARSRCCCYAVKPLRRRRPGLGLRPGAGAEARVEGAQDEDDEEEE